MREQVVDRGRLGAEERKGVHTKVLWQPLITKDK